MSRSLGVVDHLVADPDLPLGDVLEAGDHPQRGGLTRAGGADNDHELAVVDGEAHVLHGLEAVGVALADVVEDDGRHGVLDSSVKGCLRYRSAMSSCAHAARRSRPGVARGRRSDCTDAHMGSKRGSYGTLWMSFSVPHTGHTRKKSSRFAACS